MAVIGRERWRMIEPLLDQVLDLPLDERGTWLESLSRSAPDVAAELSALLAGDAIADAGGFLAHPIVVSLAGLQIGAYTLERPLGQGGMGTVWLARRTDGRFEGQAAVKLLNLSLVSAAGQQRFRREGSLLARLTHPGIARLLDAGVSTGGQPYLVLEHVDGEHIDVFAKKRALSLGERVRLMLKVLDAVGHAHANLIVHRDLKPSNILVTPDGSVKLLDFGIAKMLDAEGGADRAPLTAEGARSFTPEFAAPEQVRGDAITTTTDVYASGVLLYLLITGKHPTAEGCRTPADAIRALLEVTPTAARDGDLGIILDKALRKEPVDRYETVASLADDLRRWLRHEPISARRPSLTYRGRKFARRHRGAIAATVIGVLLASAYVVTVIIDRERVRQALAEATTSARKAEQVAEFTVGLFEASGEGSPLADTLSARELLKRGVARAHQLSAQPIVEAQMLDLIGRIHTQLRDFDEAEIELNEAFDIRRQELGENHPDVASSLMSLGELAVDRNRFSVAVPLLKRAFELRTRAYGQLDPRTTDALYSYATALHTAGTYSDARPLFEQWLTAVERQPPQLSPTRSRQLTSMSHLLHYANQEALAERFARQALAMDQTLYGSRHARVAVDLGHLGVILSSQRKVVEAESLLRESIALLRSVYPNGHADLAHALRDLAVHLTTTKRWEEAEQTWRETAAAYLAQPNESMGYANAQSFLGRATMENGKLAEAERTLRATLRLESAGVPVGNPIGVRASMYLGELLRRQGQFKEAVPLLLAAHRARMPNRHAEIYSAAALVKLYEAEGRMDEAAKYRAPSSP